MKTADYFEDQLDTWMETHPAFREVNSLGDYLKFAMPDYDQHAQETVLVGTANTAAMVVNKTVECLEDDDYREVVLLALTMGIILGRQVMGDIE